MNTQAERFTYVRERVGMSKQDFAAALGIHPTIASVIESGAREASREVLSRLAVVFKVNLNWFLTGVGESLIPDYSETESVFVPHIIQEAAAGRGVEIEDFSETRLIAVPRLLVAGLNSGALRAVTVRGDSMIDKEIYDRDIVVFNTADTSAEAICVVSVAGQLLVKHVSIDRLKGRITLMSANPMYPPRFIEGSELADVKVEGRVVTCLHNMR
jgi:SOS-response transcriptional repressor LexA